jgi:amidophosphoribosyltransferase
MHHPPDGAQSLQRTIPERMKDALRRVEGAFSIVAMTRTKLIGVRDPLGVRPLVLGRIGRRLGAGVGDLRARHHRRGIRARDRAGRDGRHQRQGRRKLPPFEPKKPRFCIFEHVYFSRPDSASSAAESVYETRRRIGVELAREAPVEADLVCPVPDSGTPAAIGYSQESASPTPWGSSATSTWAAPSSNRPSRSATWACG